VALSEIASTPNAESVIDYPLMYDGVLGDWLQGAQAAGVITQAEATRWWTELEQQHAAGHFSCGLAQFTVLARKP
jgi:hypothetical protein